jgi:hypothetical protein
MSTRLPEFRPRTLIRVPNPNTMINTLFNGTVGRSMSLLVTGVVDAAAAALTIRNRNAAGGHLRVQHSASGATVFEVTDSGPSANVAYAGEYRANWFTVNGAGAFRSVNTSGTGDISLLRRATAADVATPAIAFGRDWAENFVGMLHPDTWVMFRQRNLVPASFMRPIMHLFQANRGSGKIGGSPPDPTDWAYRTGLQIQLADEAGVAEWTVSGATNAAPIVVTTTAAHGWVTGEVVVVHGVTGNTAANGRWTITVTSPTTFSLNGTTGNGAYAGGGITNNAPAMFCLALDVVPRVARTGFPGNASAANADDLAGLVINNQGTGAGTDAIWVSGSGIAGPLWNTIMATNANVRSGVFFAGQLTDGGLDTRYATMLTGAAAVKTANNQAVVAATDAAGTGVLEGLRLDASNRWMFAGGKLAVDTAGHLSTILGVAPGLAAGPGAGGAGVSVSVTGSDTVGTIFVTTGAAPTASAIVVTLTYATAWAFNPRVLVVPSNRLTRALTGAQIVDCDQATDSTTASFVLRSGTTGLAAATTYAWNYLVMR